MTSIQLAQRATGLLRTFNAAGVLSAADVHVALRLGRLGGEDAEPVMLAAALAVRAVRSGSVCLELGRMHEIGVDGEGSGYDPEAEPVDPATLPWPEVEAVVAALRRSPLVTGGPAGPLCPLRLVDHRVGPLLYLDRYHAQEETIRRALTERAASFPLIDPDTVRGQLDRLFDAAQAPGEPVDRQRVAAALAATHWTTVVAGGPGTGKTHTIARILALLVAHQAAVGAPPPRIALAAPTGKAAARLQESVREQAGALELPELTAATLHRLLGWQRGGVTRFRHHEHNRLPYDVIVVDETSMVSLTMMSRLLPAVRPDARLVLVGDPDQLASVDAGAVLADLVAGPVEASPNPVLDQVLGGALSEPSDHSDGLSARERDRLDGGIVRLTRGRRFGGKIAELAVAVRAGDADTALGLLADGGDELSLVDPDDITAVHADVVGAARAAMVAAERGDALEALAAMESHRLLCAHRQGRYGVEHWDRQAAGWVAAAGQGAESTAGQWYPGQPLLVTANDHEARIYNGDTGVIVRVPDGSLRAALQRGSEPYLVHPTQFPGVTTVYAMTIHRSQGSQYGAVSVVVPGAESTLLTRELLYTAVTRARTRVRILGTEESLRAGIARRVLRASGLRA
ncbi:exodeoxyribonuclease V subunit alpha [Nocardia stercoris]|uniref:RecBCD enzyme subunit RecD n=1 Tax=Nocardia stercoris TaxID=2483361 RepID=A0A3M2L3G1_9NOCA|nr:exodeoxyribonuclease V subunit alpha [Nocardia stercoris]RMI32242.1 exodeoxyribonuclease V subunit alpha [Nocardia stercoris]